MKPERLELNTHQSELMATPKQVMTPDGPTPEVGKIFYGEVEGMEIELGPRCFYKV